MFPLSKLPDDLIEEIIKRRIEQIENAVCKIQKSANNKYKFNQKKLLNNFISGCDKFGWYEFSYNYTCTIIRLYAQIKHRSNKSLTKDVSIKASAYWVYRYEINDHDYEEKITKMIELGKQHGIQVW